MKISEALSAFHNPRFTTEEMETSDTACGFDFRISQLFYDDNQPGYPSHALGIVIAPISGRPMAAHWDRNGKCTVAALPVKSFDLRRPTQSQIDCYRMIGEGFIVAAVTILICIIF